MENPTSIVPHSEKENEIPILEEVMDKREKYTKHFLRKDKSYEAVVYPTPVHYKEDGVWKDIDNSLSDTTDENNENVLENKHNSYKIQLAKTTKANKLVKIKQGDYEVSWNVEGASNSQSNVRPKDVNSFNQLTPNEQKTTLTNITSTVDYKDVFPNVDLSYDVLAESVKENIIVKDQIENSNFQFNMKVKNVTPQLQKDHSIVFYDKDSPTKAVYKMDAPFMYDASGEISKDINVELLVDGDKAVLKVAPNKDWINAEGRSFPVTIDPSLSTSLDYTKISDSHVSEQYPTTNYQSSIMNKVGYGSSSARNRTYISFALPALTTADTVIGANFYLSLYSSTTSNAQVNLHEVTGSWSASSITWNTQPTYNSSIIDYKKMNGTAGTQISWDITQLVKTWYLTGINKGLMLKTKDEYSGYTEFLSSNTDPSYQGYRPQIVLAYVNNTGLENYWTYHSQDLGRSGTGNVNDFNGNLIYFHADMSMDGNRMPVSINHVFNSNERGMNMGFGLGWRLNLSQKVVYKEINGDPYYLYTDEDGTIHYLAYESASNSYKDESGLDLTLTINSSSSAERYVLKDKKDSQLSFTSTGYLYKIKDQNGNAITLSYSGSTLIAATDGSGRKTSLNYGTDGKLSTIVEPGGRTTTFIYYGNQLQTIRYADNKETNFDFDRITKLLAVTGIDGYKMQYGYNAADPYQVNSIKEVDANGVLGQSLTLTYGDNVTTFTDNKGRKTQYQFSDNGHTISIQNHKGYAQYYKYFEDNETSNGNKNKLVEESKLQQSVMNFLRNHNLEGSRFWVASNDSTSTGSSSYSTEDKYKGKQSIKINKTNATGTHRYSQEVTLEKGKTYTFSGYIKTNGVTSGNNKGAALIASYQDSTGTWKDVVSSYVNGTSSNWDRQEVTFTIPSNATSNVISAKIVLADETGIAYFDALQLEEGTVSNRYNLLENPDFRYLENGLPLSWSKNSETDANDFVTTDSSNSATLDDKVFQMKGDSTKNKNVSQTISLSGNAGDVLVFNGWAKGNSIPLNYPRYFALDLLIYYNDGTKKYIPVQFNPDSADWQYLSAMAEAEKDYYQVSLYVLYYQNENSVAFDGLQLYQESFSTSYSYDKNGNLVSSKDLAKQQGMFTYDGNNDLITTVDPKGNQFSYDYEDKHNLIKATTAANVVYSFDQDSYGNPIWGMVGDSTNFIKSTATYTTSGNYLKTVTDPSGNTVTKTYDEAEDELDSVVDPKGKVTNYQYDALSNLTSVSKEVQNQDGSTSTISNQYTYENDRLKTVTHSGGMYTFNYDTFEKQKDAFVGNQKIFTNNYESNNGNLSETLYSNNQTIGYGYDELDRITSIKYNGVEKFKYGYNESGNLGLLNDLENGINYRYEYDLANRLSKVKDSEGNFVSYGYDNNNNVTNIQEKINQQLFRTSYRYDKDNRPSSVFYFRGLPLYTWDYHFDTLGRMSDKSLSGVNVDFKTSYTYKAGINGSSTSQVESIDNNGDMISYTYDAKGNIETITTNAGRIKYSYNDLDELIREDNQLLGQSITFDYDLNGNLLIRKYYAYSEGDLSSLGASIKTDTYQYGDANWKDKLTNFNGQGIAYDAIGNPTSYNGYSYSWDRVDQLKTITGNGKTISFRYNVDGVRTEKMVNGVTTKYHLDGDVVTFESNGTDEIYYTYDSNGQLLSMNLNGQEYFYIQNEQGDIIGLINSTGNKVVSYQYDVWGKLLSITGTAKDTVGKKNPYRYRGYRYDEETGYYYLQSRYYNPEWGRFLNADSVGGEAGTLLSHNVFAYGFNNPVNMEDTSGNYPARVEGSSQSYVSRIKLPSAPPIKVDKGIIDYYGPMGGAGQTAVKVAGKMSKVKILFILLKMQMILFIMLV